MMIVSIPILLPMAIYGAILLIFGFRGKRLGDHPTCRRCGFDLFGLPAHSSVCSECGSRIDQPGAIRMGQHQRRPGLIVAGALLLFLVATAGSVIGWGVAQNTNWIEKLPAWWLIRETASADPLKRDPALGELLRRVGAGQLGNSQLSVLAARGLTIQADRTQPWVPRWGDLIEAARSAKILTDDQWRQYAINVINIQLIARPQVCRGAKSIPLRLASGAGRAGSLVLEVETNGVDAGSDLAEASVSDPFSGGTSAGANASGWRGSSMILDQTKMAAAPLGSKAVRMKIRERIFGSSQDVLNKVPPIADQTVLMRAPWTLVAADTQTVKPINDDTIRSAIEHSLTVSQCEISDGGHYTNLEIEVNCNATPLPLAYDAFVRTNGHDYPAGSFYFMPGGSGGYDFGNTSPNITPGHCDLVFKPSASVAADTIEMTSFWNGEVVIKNVPLTHR